MHNGQIIHENVERPPPTVAAMSSGIPHEPDMLQGDNGAVGIRNIYVRPTRTVTLIPVVSDLQPTPQGSRVRSVAGARARAGATEPVTKY